MGMGQNPAPSSTPIMIILIYEKHVFFFWIVVFGKFGDPLPLIGSVQAHCRQSTVSMMRMKQHSGNFRGSWRMTKNGGLDLLGNFKGTSC